MKITLTDSINCAQKLKQHYIPLYSGQVSCGLFGIADDFVDDYLSLDTKYIKNKESTFFVKAQGDSMSPYIQPGDILIVDRSIPIFNGAVATFFLNDNAICKRYTNVEGIIKLTSYSEAPDITISEEDRLELFGVVTGLARDLF